MKTIDLTKCENCGKHPKGKLAELNFKRHYPFCSYHCVVVYDTKQAALYLRTIN